MKVYINDLTPLPETGARVDAVFDYDAMCGRIYAARTVASRLQLRLRSDNVNVDAVSREARQILADLETIANQASAIARVL